IEILALSAAFISLCLLPSSPLSQSSLCHRSCRVCSLHEFYVFCENKPLGRDVELFRRHYYAPGQVGPAFKGSPESEVSADFPNKTHDPIGVRPFGVSLLIAGFDDNEPYLYQSHSFIPISFQWFFSFSTCKYIDDMELDDAVHTAILTLKEG
ncbi:hypothetical protein S245_001523, partial [Arachis hypogaea]